MTTIPEVFNILVIEDQLDEYIVIEKYAKKEHLQIKLSRANTFNRAKEILNNKHNFKLLLLDLSMPDVVCQEYLVKTIVALAPNIPIIVLTGITNKEFAAKTLSLGISDYLFKDDLTATQLAKCIYFSIERKSIHLELIESERKYKALFDSSPLPMWVLDKHTLEFLNVNDAAISLYGYTKEEFLSMNVRDLWTSDGNITIEPIWIKNYNNSFDITVSHRKKNGELLQIEVKSNPINFNGKEARVTQVKDITRQLEVESALVFSEKRFKALAQDASDLMMIMDFDGVLSYVSPTSVQLTGITDCEMIQHNLFYYIHNDDVDSVKKHVLKLKHCKRTQIPTYRIKTSNNKWRYLETIITNLSDDPSVNGLVANSRDITEFVKQENKLISSLKRYDIVAKATSDTITDYDIVNDKMYYNEGIETIFGYNKDEIESIGKWFNDKIHPEDKDRVMRYSEEVKKHKTPNIQIEYRFKCADGSYKYILDRSYVVTDSEGNPQRIIGAIQDITETHNYIKTIEDHNNRLKDIAWTQSHVVRAPLARIMGLIDLIKNYPDTAEQSQLLDHLITSANELDNIIRNISNKSENIS